MGQHDAGRTLKTRTQRCDGMHIATKITLGLGGLLTIAGIILAIIGWVAVGGAGDDPTEYLVEGGELAGGSDNILSLAAGSYDFWVDGTADPDTDVSIKAVGDSSISDKFNACPQSFLFCGNTAEDYDHIGYAVLGAVEAGFHVNLTGTQTVYVVDMAKYDEALVEDAGGGFFNLLQSFGLLCCGVFILILGGIFALTIKDKSGGVVAMAQPGMMAQPMAAQPMAAQPMAAQPMAAQPMAAQPTDQPMAAAAPAVDPAARQYYDSMVAQGHPPDHVMAWTQQQWPGFQG